jgi:hypothetical protein
VQEETAVEHGYLIQQEANMHIKTAEDVVAGTGGAALLRPGNFTRPQEHTQER